MANKTNKFKENIKKIICNSCKISSMENPKLLSGGFKIISEDDKEVLVSNCAYCSRI